MEAFLNTLYRPFVWSVIFIFIVIYPMLVSIYVFLPLFIGIMAYYFIRGIDEANYRYILITIIYFINLEVNLSLPLFLTLVAFLLVYILFYKNLNYFRRCEVCRPMFAVILLDFFYLGLLLSYDFAFQSSSVVLDNLLFYSLLVDILLVVIL